MAAQHPTQSPDRIIWRLARKQHGVVARWQLLPLGVSRHEIQRRRETRRLTEIHRGVYLVGAVPSEFSYAQAALLALKGRGTLSHFSAAHLWSLRDYPPQAPPWITAPFNGRSSRSGLHLHRATLEAVDLRKVRGLQVTSPPRTVLDCAPLYGDDYEFEALVAEAKYRGVASEAELSDQLGRNPKKRGSARLRRVLDLSGGPRRTRSKGERAFLRLLREQGIDGYETNSKVFGPELDFVWADLRFAVEIDGWDGHSGKVAFERDRLKVAELQAKDVDVMPITGRQIARDRNGVLRRLNAALAFRTG